MSYHDLYDAMLVSFYQLTELYIKKVINLTGRPD